MPSFFKVFFIDYAITVFPIFPFIPLHPVPPTLQHSSPLCSCPWVVHVNSLSPVSYTIFYLSPSILCLRIMLFLPCTFSLLFLPPSSPLNSLCVMSISDSVPVLVVCFVFVFIVTFNFHKSSHSYLQGLSRSYPAI